MKAEFDTFRTSRHEVASKVQEVPHNLELRFEASERALRAQSPRIVDEMSDESMS